MDGSLSAFGHPLHPINRHAHARTLFDLGTAMCDSIHGSGLYAALILFFATDISSISARLDSCENGYTSTIITTPSDVFTNLTSLLSGSGIEVLPQISPDLAS